MKISAIILAGNRENIITGCLKTLTWVDEIVLVDLNIKDKTLEIAEKYQVKVVKSAGQYDFSLWRNQGAKAAKGKWLLYIDTDERITKKLKDEIKAVIKTSEKDIGGYKIPRKNYFLGKWFKTDWPDYQVRLIKKDCLQNWEGKIHETPKIKGKIGKLNNPLIHLSHRSLESSLKNTINWSRLEAEARFKAGHPKMTSLRFIRILLSGFWQQFIIKKIWKNGIEGVIDGIYQMFSLFFTYFRLWELQRQETLEQTYKKIDKKLENQT
jgi:glycosyltransferase involved in cell wall biosynthesis